MTRENSALARRWFEDVWNGRRGDLIAELAAPECTGHTASGDLCTRDEFVQVHAGFMASFPDLHVTIESTIAERDEVVVRWTAEGTHAGDAFGLKATGKPILIRGLTWMRVRDGRIVEARDCWNQGGLFAELRTSAQ